MRCQFALVMLAVCTVALPLAAGGAQTPAAQPAAPTPAVSSEWQQKLERNATLGSALSQRSGTEAELDELAALAAEGLKAAREEVAAHPDSAEAHYRLGSWLVYGYRVVRVQATTYDPVGGEQTATSRQVRPGLADEPEEGLTALKQASLLAPERADYLIDYGAALLDAGQPDQGAIILKSAWAGKLTLDADQRQRVGMLLSDIWVAQGNPAEAREWAYRALAAHGGAEPALERLRRLDELAVTVAAERARQVAEHPAVTEAEVAKAAEGGPSQEPVPSGGEAPVSGHRVESSGLGDTPISSGAGVTSEEATRVSHDAGEKAVTRLLAEGRTASARKDNAGRVDLTVGNACDVRVSFRVLREGRGTWSEDYTLRPGEEVALSLDGTESDSAVAALWFADRGQADPVVSMSGGKTGPDGRWTLYGIGGLPRIDDASGSAPRPGEMGVILSITTPLSNLRSPGPNGGPPFASRARVSFALVGAPRGEDFSMAGVH